MGEFRFDLEIASRPGVLEKQEDGTVWGQYFNGTTPAARKKPPPTSGSWLDTKVVPSWTDEFDGKETFAAKRPGNRGSHKYSRTLTSWREGEQLVSYL